MLIIKKNNETKNYVRGSRIMILLVILFSNCIFSQHLNSDSLKQKKENNQLSSNAQIYVAKDAKIYDYTQQLVIATPEKDYSKPVIYATYDAIISSPNQDLEIKIIKTSQKSKNKTIARSIHKNKNFLQNKFVSESHESKSANIPLTYKALKDNSFFTIGNVVKNNGICNNTISAGKKYIQFSNEYNSINNFDKVLKRNFRDGTSYFTCKISENNFTRPPPIIM